MQNLNSFDDDEDFRSIDANDVGEGTNRNLPVYIQQSVTNREQDLSNISKLKMSANRQSDAPFLKMDRDSESISPRLPESAKDRQGLLSTNLPKLKADKKKKPAIKGDVKFNTKDVAFEKRIADLSLKTKEIAVEK